MTGRQDEMEAEAVIRLLGLQPHPEGGHFAETFRDEARDPDGRSRGTAIYYLLRAGEASAWHRVHDASEIWHWYAGAPLALSIAAPGGTEEVHMLGPDLMSGARPQAAVPAGHWQAARSTGAWTLVGCTVSPGFEFDGFELAPEGWTPADGEPSQEARRRCWPGRTRRSRRGSSRRRSQPG